MIYQIIKWWGQYRPNTNAKMEKWFHVLQRLHFTLQYENIQTTNWQEQIAMISFDELTHFSKTQFFYMLSRNRTLCGVKPYIRATCNPDADSWVADFIAWWINQDTGYPIPERSGKIRWMYRLNDEIHWGNSKKELIERLDLQRGPRSAKERDLYCLKAYGQQNSYGSGPWIYG